ncbi:MAG: hypothetical protein JST89_25430 [Cyanobacteria bacterium SZAS-4]|nr:hypothetical protein [Cyanobacteria bacterium SZAS-4]
MALFDLTRDVRDAKDTKEESKLLANLELLTNDKKAIKSTVDAYNESSKKLVADGVIPEVTITFEKDCEKVTLGDHCIKFMADGSKVEYTDDRFPLNATKIIRKDGSKTEVEWVSESVVGAILNTDMFGKQTRVEAKDGVKIDCDNSTGKITMTNADGTKTIQRPDGVVEHQDKDGKVVSYTDNAGRTLAMGGSMQNRVDAAAGRISSALAQISDPSKARDGMDQLYAILADLDPLIACADASVSAAANSAHVQVTSAMCAVESESRSNLKATA